MCRARILRSDSSGIYIISQDYPPVLTNTTPLNSQYEELATILGQYVFVSNELGIPASARRGWPGIYTYPATPRHNMNISFKNTPHAKSFVLMPTVPPANGPSLPSG